MAVHNPGIDRVQISLVLIVFQRPSWVESDFRRIRNSGICILPAQGYQYSVIRSVDNKLLTVDFDFSRVLEDSGFGGVVWGRRV